MTTRLAKTHSEIVVEGLDAAAMLGQKGLTGARARRRGLSDSALGAPRRQLAYKTRWYGSHLTIADRWYPSSKTCHVCGHKQEIGWAEHWTCNPTGASPQPVEACQRWASVSWGLRLGRNRWHADAARMCDRCL